MELLDLPTNELKSRLVNEKDFAETMRFFFDRFVDERCFMDSSRPTFAPKRLLEAASQVFAAVGKKSVVASSWQLCEVGLLNLLHGSIYTAEGLAVILWATDIDVGLLTMPDSRKPGNVVYARLTVASAKAATGSVN